MLEFLMGLDELRSTNPQAYQEAMKSLGLTPNAVDEGGDQHQSDGLASLIASIQSSRTGVTGSSGGDDATTDKLNLPGANVKNQVNILVSSPFQFNSITLSYHLPPFLSPSLYIIYHTFFFLSSF